jgi:hypothetical protein
MHAYFEFMLDPRFSQGFVFAAIALAGLGLHAGGILIHHSTVYYRETSIAVPITTNIAIFCIVTLYLLLSVFFGGPYTLVLFALSYLLRDFLAIVIPKFASRLVG